MRREPTPAEKDLWRLLRTLNRESAHFRRQVAVDRFVFDFGDYSARLLIEVDGPIHDVDEVKDRDGVKRLHAEKNGFRLLKFTNDDVWERPEWVLDQVRVLHAAPHPQPPPRKGAGA
jgi:very-short-patch-repair endonuclease